MDYYDYKPKNFDQKANDKAKDIGKNEGYEKNWDVDWDLALDKACGKDCDIDCDKDYGKDKRPIYAPTKARVYAPTEAPTYAPTKAPTYAPTKEKTYAPAYAPTKTHTFAPTYAPTFTIVFTKGVDHECVKTFMESGTEAMSQKSAELFMETFNAILKKGGEYEYQEMEKDEPDNLKDSYKTLENQVAEGFKDTQDNGMNEKITKEFMKKFDQINK